MSRYFAYDYTGAPFVLFGTWHLVALLFIVLLNVGMLGFRKSSGKTRTAVRWTIAIVLWADEASWHIWNAYWGHWTVKTMLLTLGFTSALTEAFNIVETSGVFFVGLGLTFLLVALLAKMKWAYIPAAVLLLLGFFLGTPFVGVLEYAWIGILLIAGIVLVISAARSK